MNWKKNILKFTNKFDHPAWGLSHFKRVYDLSLKLAKAEKIKIDEEILFAAAYLHDIGAFAPYKKKGIDHAERSSEVCEKILLGAGFPKNKILSVKKVIYGHMFYSEPAESKEAIMFRDADTLDFMGIIGVTRILSIIGIDDWTPDLKSAIELIKRFSNELPSKIRTKKAKNIAKIRQSEMKNYLKTLASEM